MFLRAGCVPEPGWIAAAERFMQAADGSTMPAAPPCSARRGVADLLRRAWPRCWRCCASRSAAAPRPEQGLLIARRFYDALGGHAGHDAAEAALLRKLGRRRIAMLACAAAPAALILDFVN